MYVFALYSTLLEFFNEVLHLEECFPGLLADHADSVLEKIRTDSRSGHRQDQISKAHILYSLSSQASIELLLVLVDDDCQDLDIRNAAVRILWRHPDVRDVQAVGAVRTLLRQLLPNARQAEHPADAFVVGLCYLLLNFKGRTPEDDALVKEVWGIHNPRAPVTTHEERYSWFRTQFTMGGLADDVKPRG